MGVSRRSYGSYAFLLTMHDWYIPGVTPVPLIEGIAIYAGLVCSFCVPYRLYQYSYCFLVYFRVHSSGDRGMMVNAGDRLRNEKISLQLAGVLVCWPDDAKRVCQFRREGACAQA